MKAEVLTVQHLLGTLPAGSIIRAQAVVRNPVLSATCREGIVLLPVRQSSIRFRQKEVPGAAGVVLIQVVLQVDLHIAEDLLQVGQEVHILPDHLLQVHPGDLHPLLILREAEDKTFDICFRADNSFLNRSAGIVFQKMKIL